MSRVQIKDVFDLQLGKTPSRRNSLYWNDGTIDWVSIRDLGTYDRYVGNTRERITQLAIDESGIKQVPPNTLIMSFKLSLGKTAITVKPTYTNEAIMAFIDKGLHPFDMGYLFHQFSAKDWTAGTNMAVMGATLNKKTLSESWIELPDVEEQHRIACLFDMACERIADAHRLLGTLDELIKARFVEMFGLPTKPHDNWSFDRIDHFCKVITGNTPSRKRPEYYGDGIEWIKTDNITEASYLTEASEHLSVEGQKAGRVVPTGSVLMACIAGSVKSIGKVAIANRPVAFNQQINALVPHEGMIETEYLLWMLRLSKDYLCIDINMQLKGILNKSNLSRKVFSVPPLPLQQEFAAFVAQVDQLKADTQLAIDKLQMLYDSLAQEYFSE